MKLVEDIRLPDRKPTDTEIAFLRQHPERGILGLAPGRTMKFLCRLETAGYIRIMTQYRGRRNRRRQPVGTELTVAGREARKV